MSEISKSTYWMTSTSNILFRISCFRQPNTYCKFHPETNTSNKILTASMHQNKLFRCVTFAWLKNTILMTCSLILGFPVLRKECWLTICITHHVSMFLYNQMNILVACCINIFSHYRNRHLDKPFFDLFFCCCTPR